MKKAIRNYLAKLQDNKKDKGFSLVELIIVIAIMAILVGVVASQVLPYIEKSRRSKDMESLGTVASDMVTATADAMADGSQTADDFVLTVKTDATTATASSGTGAAFGTLVYTKFKANKMKSSGSDPLKDFAKNDLKSESCGEGFTITFTKNTGTLVITSAVKTGSKAEAITVNSKLN